MSAKPRRAWVHLNLFNGRFSIKYSGQPVFYADAVHMRNCEFHINPRLRAQFDAKPSRRLVHSHVIGEIISLEPVTLPDATRISCNPFKYTAFVEPESLAKVIAAEEVVLQDRQIFASGVTLVHASQ
jgi:hypothetical protein